MTVRYVVLVLLLWICSTLTQSQTAIQSILEYNMVVNALLNPVPDSARIAVVDSLVLQRDAGTFELKHGTLVFFKPLHGHIFGAVFYGNGTITFTPSTEVERKQLSRFYETEVFHRDFNSLFLLFTDSTYNELSRKVTFAPNNVPSDFYHIVKRAIGFITNNDGTAFDLDAFRPFLYNEQNGFFYADCQSGIGKFFFFRFDPYEPEEVSLSRNYESGPLLTIEKIRETISMFHQKSYYANPAPDADDKKDYIDIKNYTMHLDIEQNLTLHNACTISFQPIIPNRKWMYFNLYNKLEVDSILWSNGSKAAFIRPEDSGDLWLYSPEPFRCDTTMAITMFYHGDIIRESEFWYFLRTSIGWYPHSNDFRDKATFDLTFRFPSKLSLASIGENTEIISSGDTTVSRWVLRIPGRNASFMVGNFEEHTFMSDSLPFIRVFQSNAHNRQTYKGLMNDIENSFRFFQYVYGKTPLSQFSAVEIPLAHGEAFPGLIDIYWLPRSSVNTEGSIQVFHAHEVAHQWWAVGVDFKTYHDQWLSEAFAQYSGLWYMQEALHDNEKFFHLLDLFKRDIFENRKYLFSTGQQAGPVWLGARNETTSTEGDYSTIVYEKGAWILHMLRNLALNLNTMNEDIFSSTMKDFYASYVGKEASTEDFRRMVEKHYGITMGWFFKEWVYNSEVPKYTILYKLEELPDGKYKVHCTVKQSGVADDFQMSVPFLIDFGEKRIARVREMIKGPVTEFDFPVLPLKPEKIKFNDLESVLCEIEGEDWE